MQKLGILEAYLDAYTTALKNQPFELVYVDAFAGTGRIMRDSGPGHETDEFSGRLLRESRTLTNSKNSPLFEFIFCAGHPRGAGIAKGIAKYLIKRM